MASTTATTMPSEQAAERAEGGLDVDWLLHKKDPHASLRRNQSTSDSPSISSAQSQSAQPSQSKAPPVQSSQNHAPIDDDSVDPFHVAPDQHAPQSNGLAQNNVPKINEPQSSSPAVQKPQTPTASPSKSSAPSPNSKQTPPEEPKNSRLSLKKDSRRSSWLSSISSKLSSSSDKSARTSSVSSNSSSRKSPQASPALEKSNPVDINAQIKNNPDDKPVIVTHTRRPSVLVAAGSETKVAQDHPNFLSSALRRLSSGNTATLGKGATTGAICARKTMNIDHNRRRTKIQDFDQNKLRRVAFKVDVEIAGIAAQADELDDQRPSGGSTASSPSNKDASSTSKDTKMAKYKDRSEGAALKKTSSREAKGSISETEDDAKQEQVKQEIQKAVKADEVPEKATEDDTPEPTEDTSKDTLQPPTTRKKEKKKRSEAERKERKEKKKRQAEANGLIPLEITVEDDDSDSSSNSAAIPGTATPKKGQPTTDPMRIYKRCCQLRETPALAVVKEQIAKPSATLAEAPGTVASIDLSGSELALADVQTLGDWLAVVPVRRLILDDCNLSDEAVRIILSGLSGCKSQEQARANRKLPRKASSQPAFEQMGVIEKLSLKNNPGISAIGWKHIALFIHLCQSLRGIDLSGIPFPASARGDLSRTSTTNASLSVPQDASHHISLSTLLARAISDRFGDKLEELILSSCGMTTRATSEIVDSAIKCKVKRLGLANNNFNLEACEHVVRYVESGVCEGLDLGGNDLNGGGHLLTQVLNEQNPLFAMSLAGCNLGYDDLQAILTHLSRLQNFKFIDLSRNHLLFDESKDVVSLLRKKLPKMRDLKRIHLSDVNMSPNQLIALAEVFPDCPVLAHVSILDNQKIVDCMNSQNPEAQEEACAVFVSLMTAVRTSGTLVAVEIEVPGQESSEVIKALSSQVVAYSLRNLERTTLSEVGAQDEKTPLDKHAPEILLHLVGHMEGYPDDLTGEDEPAPDADYMMATNGIVKALGVCLTNKDRSRGISPSVSGTATPRSGVQSTSRKPKNMSLSLVESARKIRLRLRPAMIREDQAGNSDAYRRLFMIDQTLERTIKRFEDEYPESRKESPSLLSQPSSSLPDVPSTLSRLVSIESSDPQTADIDPFSVKLARTDSNQSLAARALTQEEGRMHRFGQSMRREVLKPTGTDDILHGTSVDDIPESAAFAALRARLENYTGDEIRSEVEKRGVDPVVRELGIDLQQLRMLEREDPEAFKKLKDSQLAAQLNAGMLGREEYERRKMEGSGTVNGAVTT